MGDNLSISPCPPLSAVWCLEAGSTPLCHECHRPIESEAIIRTFRLLDDKEHGDHETGTEVIWALHNCIKLYYRHFGCLRSSNVTYLTISHVWAPHASKIQYAGSKAIYDLPELAFEASLHMFSEATRIFQGAQARIEGRFEAWMDYISVPQWEHIIKVDILLRIPDIYANSLFTIVYWDDVEPPAVESLRALTGLSSSARLTAITTVCRTMWFRRVWTAMEFIRSREVRVMLKGYYLCVDSDDLFSRTMNKVWVSEGKALGDVFELERRAGLNRNVMPWQVDGLLALRESQSRDFGMAFERLALRGCTARLDFYYALLGLVGITERLPMEPSEASILIAQRCLMKQDYSPLLMVPDIGNQARRKFYGFNDILSWGLGPTLSKPDNVLKVDGLSLRSTFHFLGRVQLIETSELIPYNNDVVHAFSQPARLVSRKVGKDVDSFVMALALRLFAVNPYAVLRHLEVTGRRQAVQKTLQSLEPDCNGILPRAETLQLIEDLGFNSMDWHSDLRPEDGNSIPSYHRQTDATCTLSLVAWKPITEYMMHGRAAHIDEWSALIGMRCPACGHVILTRAAVWITHEEAYGAMAYRIPGLYYERSLPNGVGVLLKAGRIVGRFLYCVPCCRESVTEIVELQMPTPPTPTANEFAYGNGEVFHHETSLRPMVKIDKL